MTDWGFRVLNVFHRSVLRVSGGRLGSHAYGADMVELVTMGRRSGHEHSTMLLVPIRDGANLVLVASKGGDQREPDWLKNLVANPRVRVSADSTSVEMMARIATPDERAFWWPRVVTRYRRYEEYQRRGAREIPLVICHPRDESSQEF